MDTTIVFQQMIIMFLLMALGFVLYRAKVFSTKAPTDFSKLITEVCNPALMISSALNRDSAADEENILLAALIAVIYYIVLVGLGMLIPRIIRAKKSEIKFYQLLATFGNIGFMGIPVLTVVMGNGVIIYLSFFIVIFNLLIYTYGITVLTGNGKGKNRKIKWQKMINPGAIASIVTILIYLTGITAPKMIGQTLQYVGQCTTFIAMAINGMALAQIPAKRLFTEYRLYPFMILRFLLLPIVVALCLKPFMHNEILLGVMVLTLALPSGNMALMMAKQYGEETDILAKGIVLSTVFSVVTVTVASWFLML